MIPKSDPATPSMIEREACYKEGIKALVPWNGFRDGPKRAPMPCKHCGNILGKGDGWGFYCKNCKEKDPEYGKPVCISLNCKEPVPRPTADIFHCPYCQMIHAEGARRNFRYRARKGYPQKPQTQEQATG